jgi:hypothetical protein
VTDYLIHHLYHSHPAQEGDLIEFQEASFNKYGMQVPCPNREPQTGIVVLDKAGQASIEYFHPIILVNVMLPLSFFTYRVISRVSESLDVNEQ